MSYELRKLEVMQPDRAATRRGAARVQRENEKRLKEMSEPQRGGQAVDSGRLDNT